MRGALITCSVIVAATVLAAGQPVPTVRFGIDNRQCRAAAVKGEWERELRERLPEFVALWNTVGPRMVTAVSTLTGRPFSPAGSVSLTLCDVPSNSFFGTTVNMRFALRSFTPSPVPLRYKVDTAFHEMLHEFVGRHVPGTSPLLRAHASASRCVANHLHLLALQKAVLLAGGDGAALDVVIATDSALPSSCYKTAWGIVNASPTAYESFVRELSTSGAPR